MCWPYRYLLNITALADIFTLWSDDQLQVFFHRTTYYYTWGSCTRLPYKAFQGKWQKPNKPTHTHTNKNQKLEDDTRLLKLCISFDWRIEKSSQMTFIWTTPNFFQDLSLIKLYTASKENIFITIVDVFYILPGKFPVHKNDARKCCLVGSPSSC